MKRFRAIVIILLVIGSMAAIAGPHTSFFAVSGTLNGQGASWNLGVPLKT